MAKPKSDGRRNKQRGTSANRSKYKELPATHWAHAVAMLAEKIKTSESESNKQSPEELDFDIMRVRRLSSQI